MPTLDSLLIAVALIFNSIMYAGIVVYLTRKLPGEVHDAVYTEVRQQDERIRKRNAVKQAESIPPFTEPSTLTPPNNSQQVTNTLPEGKPFALGR